MSYPSNESLKNSNTDNDAAIVIKSSEVKDADVRKRIDELLEKKRLKDLLDESDDW